MQTSVCNISEHLFTYHCTLDYFLLFYPLFLCIFKRTAHYIRLTMFDSFYLLTHLRKTAQLNICAPNEYLAFLMCQTNNDIWQFYLFCYVYFVTQIFNLNSNSIKPSVYSFEKTAQKHRNVHQMSALLFECVTHTLWVNRWIWNK